MLLLATASLTLAFQDPPPGEVISTAPPPAAASTLADPFAAPPPPRAQSSVDFSAYAETVAERAPASSGTVADTVTPRPAERPRFSLGHLAEGPVWGPSAQPVEPFDRAFANSRASGAPAAASATREPLPAEALSDPVYYAARQCRPEVRPASEGVAECFDRIDRAVREEQDRRAAARRPRTTCTRDETRDDDGRTSSTSGRCVIGTGDPAELERVLGW
ncbi:MAG: hypothetical protein KJ676_07980 [Alphaproteobacteria bacterium]|nr:hypothetical protein [Alphaproteobacteria bacterium]MBU1525584.1 hypothetical protein [Alphaproteobacteria bacterium]MBU2116379.1 hypothetical protein [Alphaproteobacteria bacterium]MBU2350250.1 hypothetical protein [Alphaproteobacteria bacterium]MBU2381380.1 hypothetical protein [Alphaproteobacteria bacterium]